MDIWTVFLIMGLITGLVGTAIGVFGDDDDILRGAGLVLLLITGILGFLAFMVSVEHEVEKDHQQRLAQTEEQIRQRIDAAVAEAVVETLIRENLMEMQRESY